MDESSAGPIRIEDIDDPRVEVYRNIRDADLVGRRGVFIAEGKLVVRVLLSRSRDSGGFRAQSVLVNRSGYESMADALVGLGPGRPVYVAEQGVLDGIVGFHIHRGVLACGTREEAPDAETIIACAAPGGGPLVVLEDLANHDNVGGVFRNAAAFGSPGVLLTPRCCDPLYRKAIRVSMGCALTVPYASVASAARACELLRARGWTTLALTPSGDSSELGETLRTMERVDRLAILLGAEGPGLTREAMDAADHRVRIAIAEGVDSLNVAVAGAVAMHAIYSR